MLGRHSARYGNCDVVKWFWEMLDNTELSSFLSHSLSQSFITESMWRFSYLCD